MAYLLLSNDRTCRDIPPRVSLPVLLPSSFLPSQMLFFFMLHFSIFRDFPALETGNHTGRHGTHISWVIYVACSFICPKPHFLEDLRDASFWNIITDFLSFYGTLVPPLQCLAIWWNTLCWEVGKVKNLRILIKAPWWPPFFENYAVCRPALLFGRFRSLHLNCCESPSLTIEESNFETLRFASILVHNYMIYNI